MPDITPEKGDQLPKEAVEMGRTMPPPPPWWIASYPKSGNTWVRFFMSAYRDGRCDITKPSFATTDTPRYFYHALAPRPAHEMLPWEVACLRGAVLHHMAVANRPYRLWLKSHGALARISGFQMFPADLVGGVIYVVRDPRDVCVSFADHLGKTLDEQVDFMLAPDSALNSEGLYQPVASWYYNVVSWIRERDRNVHVVRYEDMLHEPLETFRGIIEFAEWEMDEDRLRSAITLSSFDRLRAQEDEHGFMERSQHSEKFFRKGQAGGWREVMTDEQVALLEQGRGGEDDPPGCGEAMQEIGYECLTMSTESSLRETTVAAVP